VVVLGAGREATARHVVRKAALASLPVAFITQLPGLTGSTGAVLSAKPWFAQRNLVLLPDQVLASPPRDLVASALDALSDAPFCFLASRQDDPAAITRDGALSISGPPRGCWTTPSTLPWPMPGGSTPPGSASGSAATTPMRPCPWCTGPSLAGRSPRRT
jgi:hypothetical protein